MNNSDVIVVQTDDDESAASSPSSPHRPRIIAASSVSTTAHNNNSHNSSDVIINDDDDEVDNDDDDGDESFEAINHKAASQVYRSKMAAAVASAATNNTTSSSTNLNSTPVADVSVTASPSSGSAVVCPKITVHAGPPPKRYIAVKRTSAPASSAPSSSSLNKSSDIVKSVSKPQTRKIEQHYYESSGESENGIDYDDDDEEDDDDEDEESSYLTAPKRRSTRQVKKPRILEEFLTDNTINQTCHGITTSSNVAAQGATASSQASTSQCQSTGTVESHRQPFKQIARKSTTPHHNVVIPPPAPRIFKSSSSNQQVNSNSANPATSKSTSTSTTVAMNGNKQMRHKLIMCRPVLVSKGTVCCPPVKDASTQVDLDELPTCPTIVPVPVPVHIPMPMCMYQAPMPVPLLIPVPVAVPIFIPTTKRTFDRVQRKIKKLCHNFPSDPYEFELLLYAERLAREEGIPGFEESSDGESSSDEDNPKHQQRRHKNNKLTNRSISEPMDTQISIKTHHDGGLIHDQNNHQMSYAAAAPIEYSNSNHLQQSNEQHHQLVMQQQQQSPVGYFKWNLGVKAFNSWLPTKLERLKQQNHHQFSGGGVLPNDLLKLKNHELNLLMAEFVKEVRKVNGEMYAPESIYYICLGIQYYLQEKGQRCENMFLDMSGHLFEEFQEQFDRVVPMRYTIRIDAEGQIVSKIDEEVMWESKQLGVHSPAVLLNTILYFNTKFFFLDKCEAHKKLSFANVKRHSKRNVGPGGEDYGRSSFLRYYPEFQGLEQVIYEQGENYDNPTRCPVELYNFYLSKCPESVKNRNDLFYLMPEKASLPNSPVWFSNQPVSDRMLERMLNRIKMVKEVNELLLAAAPATSSVIIQ